MGKEIKMISVADELKKYREFSYLVGNERLGLNQIKRTLDEVFNFDSFKSDYQEIVILKALKREKLFAILSTGSGKSTAFLLPAYLRRKVGFTLVISPLKALMNQFHDRFKWVATIHSDVDDKWKVWRDIENGKIHLLLCAPETIRNSNFRGHLIRSIARSKRKLDSIYLDEVHCVSDWGHDFRPEYWWVAEHLFDLLKRARINNIPMIFLTATANQFVEKEVLELFRLTGRNSIPQENIIRGPVARPEIFIAARACKDNKDKFKWAHKFIVRQANRPLPRGAKRRVLIYTEEAVDKSLEDNGMTVTEIKSKKRLKANELAEVLEKQSSKRCKISSMTFSSKGMKPEERERTIKFFNNATSQKGQVRLVVATSAFGMGMDYDRVPGVLHFYPRPTLSEYWQQVGRAGRGFDITDGQWAEALCLHSEGDMSRAIFLAKAPALDGIFNSFTIPALNLFIVWENPPGSSQVSLLTPTRIKSKFGKLVDYTLKDNLHILGNPRQLHIFPNKYGVAWGYPINILKLRDKKDELKQLIKQKGCVPKPAKKYIRYLLIAAASAPKKFVRLDQMDYGSDRYGTVLSRLSRWADIGALERDYNLGRPGLVTLRVKRVKLTGNLVASIISEWKKWAEAKECDFNKLEDVLKARSHGRRCNIIYNTFLDRKSKPAQISKYSSDQLHDKVPNWMI